MNYLEEAGKYQDLMVSERRYFHQHPELSGLESNTVAHIKEFLDGIGAEYEEVPDGGILVFYRGSNPGKTVLLRGDIDALPIQEAKENTKGPKACISLNDGVSHACGHDAHTAMLMGVAKVLSGVDKADIPGTIILMFERGEENTENVLKLYKHIESNNIHIDSSFALHVCNSLDTGTIAVNDDNVSAGSFTFSLKISGHGGHGSRPDLANSPIECFVAIYNEISSIRLRKISPFKPLTFSMGQVQAGGSANAIPDELTFKGTSRFYDFENGHLFKNELINILEQTCPIYNCTYSGYMGGINRATVNNPECRDLARKTLSDIFDTKNIIAANPEMDNETMSRTLLKWPGVYARLGTRNLSKGSTSNLHTSEFDIDEDALKFGAAAHLAYAFAFLNSDIDTSKYAYKGTFADMAMEEGANRDRIDYFLGNIPDLKLTYT